MAATAKELLKLAVERRLLTMDQARAVVGKMREGGKFAELLRDVGGLTPEQVRSLSAPAPPPPPPRRPMRRSPPPPPKKGGRAKFLALSLGSVVLLGVGVGYAVVKSKEKPKPPVNGGGPVDDGGGSGPETGLTDGHRRLIEQTRLEVDVETGVEDFAAAMSLWDRLAKGEQGEFLAAIEKERAALRADIERRWEDLATAARGAIERHQFDSAHQTYMRALKWKLPDYRDRAFAAYADMVKIENEWLSGAPKGLDALRAERQAAVERLRAEDGHRKAFRDAVAAGDVAEARRRIGEFPDGPLRAQGGMILELAETAGAELAEALQKQVGSRVSLAFERNENFDVHTGKLTSVADGSLTIETDDGPVTERIGHLDRGAQRQLVASDAGKAFYLLLADDYDNAQVPLGRLGKLDAIGLFRDSPSAVAASYATAWAAAKNLAGEKQRDYEGAYRLLTLLLAGEGVPEPRRLEMMELRARCAVHLGDFGGAMLDVAAMLDAGEVTDSALAILDHVLNRQGLLDEALALVERTVKAHPDKAELYGPQLRLYHMLGRREDMAAAYRDAPPKAKEEGLFETLGRWMEAQEGCFSGTPVEKTVGQYRIQTDAGDELAGRVGAFMNERYAEYSRLFPFPKNDELKFLVKVFAKRADFDAYQKKLSPDLVGEHDRLGGFYDPIAKELVMPNEADLMETLRHEGFHQFLDFFTGGAPKWFNEGTASYFETSTVDARKMNPERMESAKRAQKADGARSLTELLTMDGATWRAFKAQHLLYGQSWSFIYLVVKEGRRDVLDRYFKILMRGEGDVRAYHVCFDGLLKVGEWNSKWSQWIEKHDGASDD